MVIINRWQGKASGDSAKPKKRVTTLYYQLDIDIIKMTKMNTTSVSMITWGFIFFRFNVSLRRTASLPPTVDPLILPGQKFVQLVSGIVSNYRQSVGEPLKRFYIIDLAGGN